MCLKTQYSYTACGCPADKPAKKNICWLQYCEQAKAFSPSRPCEDLDDEKMSIMKLSGLCPACLIAPKHDAEAKGTVFRIETEELRAYKRKGPEPELRHGFDCPTM